MANLRRSIPSMSALATFEAAVSRQIRLSEDDRNIRLFARANRVWC